MKYFARSGALTGFPELVRSYGQNPSALLREAGLSTAVLHDSDLYIPYPALARLLVLAARHCNDPVFGARLGDRQGLEAVGALGSLLCMQATLPDALRMLQRNLDFHARGVQVDVDLSAGLATIRMRFAFERETDCSQLAGLSIALLVRGLSQLHQEKLPPTAVELAVPDVGQGSEYEGIFAAPVSLGAPENSASYPSSGMALRINPATRIRERLSHQWRGYWGQSSEVPLTVQVERAITALLPTGECSLSMVARIVGLHPRTLQHHLKEHGASYGQLLETVRVGLARQYLANSDMDLTTLAMNLGYADLAPFSRVFRKWCGQSPRQWRKANAGGLPDQDFPATRGYPPTDPQ